MASQDYCTLEAAKTLLLILKAKNLLRRKMIIERTLEKKEKTLDTLQQLLDQIQGAETNTKVKNWIIINTESHLPKSITMKLGWKYPVDPVWLS